eukprot:NODE_702_length_4592_cov_0.718673.p2 type:complete len:291 gc:universal NODE_702_length_4592_cov_0.718673:3029-3901(+)
MSLRDSEYQEIMKFIKESDLNFMYISGIPGCGKTHTVSRIKNTYYCNCMCDKLVLENEVTILDEIDHLNEKDWMLVCQYILNGNKVIGIANTLDLSCIPDDLLDTIQVLSFSPYNAQEILEIARELIMTMSMEISDQVLDFLSRKVANVDSDIRRLVSWIKQLPDSPTITDAVAITKNSQLTLYNNSSIHAKHLLCLLFLSFNQIIYQKKSYKSSLQNIYQLCKPLYKNKHSVPCPSYSEFLDLLNVLESKSFVNIKKGILSLDERVEDSLFKNDSVTKALYFSNLEEKE